LVDGESALGRFRVNVLKAKGRVLEGSGDGFSSPSAGRSEAGAGVGWLRILVVEHKAQRHNGSFALVSRFVPGVYSAAPVYLKTGHVRHNENRASGAGKRLTKAQEASFLGGAGAVRLYEEKSAFVVVVR
jgi:hypothetical protein